MSWPGAESCRSVTLGTSCPSPGVGGAAAVETPHLGTPALHRRAHTPPGLLRLRSQLRPHTAVPRRSHGDLICCVLGWAVCTSGEPMAASGRGMVAWPSLLASFGRPEAPWPPSDGQGSTGPSRPVCLLCGGPAPWLYGRRVGKGTRRPWLAGRSAPCDSEVSFPGTAPTGLDKLLAGQRLPSPLPGFISP